MWQKEATKCKTRNRNWIALEWNSWSNPSNCFHWSIYNGILWTKQNHFSQCWMCHLGLSQGRKSLWFSHASCWNDFDWCRKYPSCRNIIMVLLPYKHLERILQDNQEILDLLSALGWQLYQLRKLNEHYLALFNTISAFIFI